MKRTIGLPLIALALVTAGCTSTGSVDESTQSSAVPMTSAAGTPPGTGSDVEPPSTDPDSANQGPVGFAPAALQQFGDCSAFLDYVHTDGADRVGPYGFGNDGFPGLFDDRVFEASAQEDAPAATEAASTNTVSTGKASVPTAELATSEGGGGDGGGEGGGGDGGGSHAHDLASLARKIPRYTYVNGYEPANVHVDLFLLLIRKTGFF